MEPQAQPQLFNPTPFANEWQRRMGNAIGMGVDGDYSEDALRRRQMSDALAAADQKEKDAILARRMAQPVDYTDESKISAAQQAVPFGRRFLAEQNGMNYPLLVEQSANLRTGEDLPALRSYRAVEGQTDAYGNADALDQKIAGHPEFVKLMASNPEVAKQVYTRLRSMSGRAPSDYDKDMAGSEAFRKAKFATVAKNQEMLQDRGRAEVFKGLTDGSYYDPQGSRWMEKVQTETPDPTSVSGRMIRQVVNQQATPYMQQLYNQHGFGMLGSQRQLPETRGQKEFTYRMQKHGASPEFAAERARIESASGFTMTPEELNELASRIEMRQLTGQALPNQATKMAAENASIWQRLDPNRDPAANKVSSGIDWLNSKLGGGPR